MGVRGHAHLWITTPRESLKQAIQKAEAFVRRSSEYEPEAWRAAAHDALTEMAEDSTDPERAARLHELVTAIPTLSRAQVEERYRAIIRK